MQIPAPIELSPFIKHYLFIDFRMDSTKKYRLFPNGNTGLVLVLSDRSSVAKVNNTSASNSFVFGQMTRFIDIELTQSVEILVVVFQPHGLYKLTKTPGKELQNSILDAELVFGKIIKGLLPVLTGKSGRISEIIDYLNTYFRKYFLRRTERSSSLIPDIVHRIQKRRGIVSIKELTADFTIHERKLQRIFSEQVGISPKKFTTIVKLHSFLGYANADISGQNLTRSAYAAGYYDQSHLIKEFKNITGMTPSRYNISSTLAINLVEI